MKPKSISQVHTVCRNCVFATKTNGVQTGCSLGKLDDYRNNGIDVLEVYDDEDEKFYLIDGRFCMFYRNEESLEDVPRDQWEQVTVERTKVPYHAILFVRPNAALVDIKDALRRLRKQATPPKIVTIINQQYLPYTEDPNNHVKPSVILDELLNSHFQMFSMKNVYNSELSDRDLIDLAYDGTKDRPYTFYIVFETGCDISPSFSKDLNDAILISMKQIGFCAPVDTINYMLVNRTAHKKYGGNSFGVPIEEKIQKYEEGASKFLFKPTDIWQ